MKYKKILLSSVSVLALAVPALTISCGTFNEPKIIKQSDVVIDEYLLGEISDSNLNKIQSTLSKFNGLVDKLEFKDERYKDTYLLTNNMFKTQYFFLEDAGYYIKLERIEMGAYDKTPFEPDITKALDSKNNKFKAKVKYIYSIYQKKEGKNIAFVPGKTVEHEIVKEKTFNTVDKVSVKFDQTIAKPIYVDWSTNKKWIEAEIDHWSDGDTVQIKNIKYPNHTMLSDLGKTQRIRLEGIDTPEKAVGGRPAKGLEYSFALLSTRFGEENFAQGMKIRVLTAGGLDGFGRLVGDFYFGDQFQYSYCTEITRAGLTLPHNSNFQSDAVKIGLKDSVEHYSYLETAKALEDAITNKRGYFSMIPSPHIISSLIYKMKPNNNYLTFLKESKQNYFNLADKAYPVGNAGKYDATEITYK